MESWPLIKKNSRLTCGDVSHVVRETFRDYYVENRSFTDHSSNVKSELSNPELQKCANEIEKAFQEHQRNVQDIQEVEKIIFKDTLECIKRDDFINTNVGANSNMKLRRHPIFKDLDPELVQKYSLIQSDDLLPTRIERMTDFTFDNDLRNHYKQHLDSESYSSLIQCHYRENNKNTLYKAYTCSKNIESLKCPEFKTTKLNQKIKFPAINEWTTGLSCRKSIKKTYVEKHAIRLRAEPAKIIFSDYKINVAYEQLVKIRNVAGSITRFAIPVFNDHTKFKIIWKNLTTSLTPGMCATFVVRFFTVTYDDTTTQIHFRVQDGHDLTIQLISKRATPLLTGVMFYGSSNLRLYQTLSRMSSQINKVLNSTIECKPCLIGTTNTIMLSFCKYGADSSYFLISEYSWYNMIVNEITTSLEIKLPPFKIYPAYFTLKSNEIIDIKIEYSPQEFGLHLNKLIVICDNCTYDYLDLVGDGLYFQPEYIILQACEKNYSIVYDSDYDSKYVLDLGNVLTLRSSNEFRIYVTNRSVLKFQYRWEFRRPEYKMNRKTTMLCMNPNWIKLDPLKGRLDSETDTQFNLSVVGNTLIGGNYRYVMEFYITNIPVAALADNHNFTVVDSHNDEESNRVDILIGEIELWLQIDEASILIDPTIIHVQVNNTEDLAAAVKKIQVLNLCDQTLECIWSNKSNTFEKKIKIFPEKFVLEASKVFQCKIIMNTVSEEDIQEEFVCQVYGTNVKMSLFIHLTLSIPMITASTNVLNFGFVKFSSNVARYFRITNNSILPLKWFITEYIFDHVTKSLRKAYNTCLNKQNGNLLTKEHSVELEYTLYTGKLGKWCSILVVTTMISCETIGTDFVLVFGEIIRPVLSLQAPATSTATLRVPTSYIHVKRFYYLQLRNNSPVKLSYVWGQPEGRDLDKLDFSIWPMDGIIQPLAIIKLYIVLDPQKFGQVIDFHVPCFVGKNFKRLWLSVETTIKDISVLIYTAYKSNPYSFVQWPPDAEEITPLCITPSEYTRSLTKSSTLSTSMESLSDAKSEKSMIYYDASGMHIDRKFTTKTQSEEESEIWSEDFPSGMTYTTYSSRDSFITLPTLSHRSMKYYHKQSKSNQNLPYQMKIVLKNVQVRRPYRRTILIKNLTPISAVYWISVKNFSVKDVKIPVPLIDRIETRLSIQEQERWCHRLNQMSVGFMVYVDPVSGVIEPNDYTLFEIWVYGDTWGTYLEEITVNIERQQPFVLHLSVEVVGHPLIFPMLCNNVRKNLTVRFGTMAYESESVTRKIKVKNTSSICVHVVWHVFLKYNDGNRKDGVCMSKTKPFNLVLDLFSPSECENINLLPPYPCNCFENNTNLELLLSPFMGDEDLYIFTITPKEMRIDPQATGAIEVTFNPKEFHPTWNNLKIEAQIIGHVKISQSNKSQEQIFDRPSLYKTCTTKIKLEALLVMPLSHLELIKGDIKFKIFAAEVISKKKPWRIRRLYLLRNNNRVHMNIRLSVKEPFKIIEVKTKNSDEKSTENKAMHAIIDPGLCAEILIECRITKQFIQEISDSISVTGESRYTFLDKTVVLSHQLVVEQPDLVTQTVPLEISIIYPEISISTLDLDFGPVTIGSSKKLIFSLINRTCSNMEFTITRKSQTSNFTMEPLKGTLSRTLAGRSYPFDIRVIFKPTEIKRYMDTVIVCTGISNYYQEVNIEGRGTLNLRFTEDHFS